MMDRTLRLINDGYPDTPYYFGDIYGPFTLKHLELIFGDYDKNVVKELGALIVGLSFNYLRCENKADGLKVIEYLESCLVMNKLLK